MIAGDPERRAFRALIRSLRDPSEIWRQGDLTIDNASLGLRMWTANIPILHTNLYKPGPLRLSLWERWQLYRAISIARANQLIRQLSAGPDAPRPRLAIVRDIERTP